jgi:AAA domain
VKLNSISTGAAVHVRCVNTHTNDSTVTAEAFLAVGTSWDLLLTAGDYCCSPAFHLFAGMVRTPLFVAATRQHVGKTTVSLALINGLKKRFKEVGFIKPVGQQHVSSHWLLRVCICI